MTRPSGGSLPDGRVRALLSLLARVQGRGCAPLRARELLLTGLCEIVAADRASWATPAEVPAEARGGVMLRPDGTLLADLSKAEGEAQILRFERSPGRPPFSDDDVRLLSLLAAEGRWLVPPLPAPPAQVEGLSPRRRQVLDLLLGGASERAVAARLQLSPHTVHECVVYLYRHFQVRSRGELLARFIHRR